MFSLVYLKDNVFGVIDKDTSKFHKLNKKQFEVLVYSAREEHVNVDGVTFESDTVFTFTPVAFTSKLNIYNALPYISGVKIVDGKDIDAYSMYFMKLLSMAQVSDVSSSDILRTIGLFAYYSLRIDISYRVEQKFLNVVLSCIAMGDNHIEEVLLTEPFEDDVMRKFHIEPVVMRKGKLRN